MRNGVTLSNKYVAVQQRITASFGFTLTEVAIVLCVVGIILGGIFMAASAAQYRIRLNQGLDEISLMVNNVRSFYASQNASGAAVVVFGAAGETKFINEGIFPKEMLRPPVNAVADNPWDQTVANGSVEIQVNQPKVSQFIVRYINIPSDVCADLLIGNSIPGPDTGLVEIAIGATTFTSALNQLPLTPIQAAAACPALPVGATYTIDWYYTLGS